MTDSPLKITVIGGCHVVGYPIGKSNGFVSFCEEKLRNQQANILVQSFPYQNLKKSVDATRICEETNPDVLVLQLGNYLFNPVLFRSLRKIVRKKSGYDKPYQSKELPSFIPGIDTDSTFVPTKKYLLQQAFKKILHGFIFYNALNKEKCLHHIDNYFTAIQKQGIKKVVVLSPLPTADGVMNYYRKAGSKLLYQKCKEYGFEFIDAYAAIQEKFSGQAFTIDNMHLSKEAHEFLANVLFHHINRFVPIIKKKKNAASFTPVSEIA